MRKARADWCMFACYLHMISRVQCAGLLRQNSMHGFPQFFQWHVLEHVMAWTSCVNNLPLMLCLHSAFLSRHMFHNHHTHLPPHSHPPHPPYA